MRVYPSQVYGVARNDPWIGYLLPTYLPTPERYVYDYVREACGVPVTDPLRPQDTVEWGAKFPLGIGARMTLPLSFSTPPTMMVYANTARTNNQAIPVVRGWPAYPAKLPQIGVALGQDSEDDQHEVEGAGFAGEVTAYDLNGNVVATADYFAEPLYSTIVVELIHENRDERDRLHDELRRVLFPLRNRLPDRNHLIRRVRVDAEKQELPIDEQPLVIYVSLFTVHVYYEMLVAENVMGSDSNIAALQINLGVNPEYGNATDPTVVAPVVGGITFGAGGLGAVFPFEGEGLTFAPTVTLSYPTP